LITRDLVQIPKYALTLRTVKVYRPNNQGNQRVARKNRMAKKQMNICSFSERRPTNLINRDRIGKTAGACHRGRVVRARQAGPKSALLR
jgi:hypothetical protein